MLTSMTLQFSATGTSESSPITLQSIAVGGSHSKIKQVLIWGPGSVLPWSCHRWWEAPARSKESASSERLSSTSDQERCPSFPRTCGYYRRFIPHFATVATVHQGMNFQILKIPPFMLWEHAHGKFGINQKRSL